MSCKLEAPSKSLGPRCFRLQPCPGGAESGAPSAGRFPKTHGCAERCAVFAPFGRKNHGYAERGGARRRAAGRRRGALRPPTWANAIRAPAVARRAPASAPHNRAFFAPRACKTDVAPHNRGFPARRLAGRGGGAPAEAAGVGCGAWETAAAPHNRGFPACRLESRGGGAPAEASQAGAGSASARTSPCTVCCRARGGLRPSRTTWPCTAGGLAGSTSCLTAGRAL